MKLWTINRVLRAVGFVLVVETGEGQSTRLWIERRRTYDARATLKNPWPGSS